MHNILLLKIKTHVSNAYLPQNGLIDTIMRNIYVLQFINSAFKKLHMNNAYCHMFIYIYNQFKKSNM